MPFSFSRTVAFPQSAEEFIRLAHKAADDGRYDIAIERMYRADAMSHSIDNMVTIADMMSQAGMYDESNLLIVRNFPDADERPKKVLEIMRRNYFGLCEYTQERKMICMYKDKFGTPSPLSSDMEVMIQEDIEDADDFDFADFGGAFSSPFLFDHEMNRSDLSMIDEFSYDIDPVMAICIVIRARMAMMRGDFEQVCELFDIVVNQYIDKFTDKEKIAELFDEGEITDEEIYVFENIGYAIIAAIMEDRKDKALKLYDMSRKISEYVETRYSAYLAGMLIYAALKHGVGNVPDMPASFEYDINDAVCAVRMFLYIEDYEHALFFAKIIQKVYPYNPDALHLYSVCCYGMGLYDEAYNKYDMLCKMLPYDRRAKSLRKICYNSQVQAKNGEKVTITKLPPSYMMPLEEANIYAHNIGIINHLQTVELSAKLYEDTQFKESILFVMPLLDSMSQISIVEKICMCSGEIVYEMLREILLDEDTDHNAKEKAIDYLMKKHIGFPVSVGYGEVLIESKSNYFLDLDFIRTDVESLYRQCIKNAKHTHGTMCVLAINDLMKYYCDIGADFDDIATISEDELRAVFALLHYRAAKKCCYAETLDTFLKQYQVSIENVEGAAEYLAETEREFVYEVFSDM